ncbi:MAG: MFS transporter [Clostridiales bacterium]|nr:MFS transporter [Clostridiales bacterium]
MRILRILLIAAGACFVYGVNCGLRGNYGILLNAIMSNSGVSYEKLSFIVAIGQLTFGVAQPIFGAVALRKSNLMVLLFGAAMIIAGLVGTAVCHSFLTLLLMFGILLPVGTGALSFGVIMSTITPAIGEKKAAAVSGFISASSGIGSSIFSSLIPSCLAAGGLLMAMTTLCIPALILIPISLCIASGGGKNEYATEREPILPMVKTALSNRAYLIVMLGFFNCGFHMCIIETHLYSQFLNSGITTDSAAKAFAFYGIATVLGCLISGFVSSRLPMNRVLGFIYTSRAMIVALWLLAPKCYLTAMLTSGLLGLTGAATVTPTSGMVSKLFGAARLGTLFGFCFFAHQIGAFLSAWLGGLSVSATGSYTFIWCVGIFLSLAAGNGCLFGIKND